MNEELQNAIRYARPYVSRILRRNLDAVEDVLQTAALHAWLRADSFRGDSQFKSWFVSVAKNAALMHLRKNKRVFTPIDAAFDVPSKAVSPETQAIESERVRILREAIKRLTPKKRESANNALLEIPIGNAPGPKALRFQMRHSLRPILRKRGL